MLLYFLCSQSLAVEQGTDTQLLISTTNKENSDMFVSTSRFHVVLAHALTLHLANRACTSQECFGAGTHKQLKDAL